MQNEVPLMKTAPPPKVHSPPPTWLSANTRPSRSQGAPGPGACGVRNIVVDLHSQGKKKKTRAREGKRGGGVVVVSLSRLWVKYAHR